MPVQRAIVEVKSAMLCTEFGQQKALEWFGVDIAEIERRYGRYTKGKNKGQLRGNVCWCKIVEGGWVREWQGVLHPSKRLALMVGKYEEWCEVMNRPWYQTPWVHLDTKQVIKCAAEVLTFNTEQA